MIFSLGLTLEALMKRFIYFVSKILFLFSVALILINLLGLFIPLRNKEIFNEKDTRFKQDITLTEEQVFRAIDEDIFDKKSYVKTITQTISKGIAHYWHDEGIDKYNLRIPFYENYLLFIASYIIPKHFLKYEFMDYRRAIDRGVGLCSQHAIIIAEVLKEKGIYSRVICLSGHIVATAQVDNENNEWWVVDSDYGVVIPHSIDSIEKRTEIISPYYREHGYDESVISKLIKIYGKEGNMLFGGKGAKNYSLLNYMLEKAAYILIWILPVLLMLPLLIYQYSNRKVIQQGSTPDSNSAVIH